MNNPFNEEAVSVIATSRIYLPSTSFLLGNLKSGQITINRNRKDEKELEMLIKRLPTIFLLPFSKALDQTRKWRWLRLLFTFAFVLVTLAWIFLLVILVFSEDELALPLPASRVSLLFLLFLFLSAYACDAVIMLRKDHDAARLALNDWQKVKEKGKLRFIFTSYTIEILLVVIWLYILDAKRYRG